MSARPSVSEFRLVSLADVNVCSSSVRLSTIGPTTVDSDDGILSVGRSEFVLSLLELSVMVDDSARDVDDWTCCWTSAGSESDGRCDGSSAAGLSSSLTFVSGVVATDCEVICSTETNAELHCNATDASYQ